MRIPKGLGTKEELQAELRKIRKEDEYRKKMCDTSPFPWCNGAVGCDTCEYEVQD